MTTAAIGAPQVERAGRVPMVTALAAVYVLWGATFLALRNTVAELPPLLTIAIRCAGGGALLFCGCHAALAWAQQRVASGRAALLLTSIPFWLMLLDSAQRHRAPSGRVVLGLLIGVAGVAVLAGSDSSWSGTAVDRAAIVAGGLCWAAGSLVARHGARPRSVAESTAMHLAAGAAFLTLGSLAAGELAAPGRAPSARAVTALVYLIVCGTTLAFAASTWLLRVTTAAAAGSYAFVNPIVAVGLAWVARDEPPSGRTATAAALVVGAVALVRDPLPGELR